MINGKRSEMRFNRSSWLLSCSGLRLLLLLIELRQCCSVSMSFLFVVYWKGRTK